MSWVFGSIDFETYGVKVSQSSGVLDLPKLSIQGYDWLDEDGRDYWQSEIKYDDRDIILNCWIAAEKTEGGSGYANFKTKVNAFTTALKNQGKVTFQTPYISIENCSVITGVTVLRETNYVQDVQVGTFTLRIKVHGDSPFELVNICRFYPDNIKAVVKTKNLKVVKSLQGDWYATMSFESNTILDIQYWDYITVNSNGVNGDLFHLVTVPEFKKVSTNKYQYNLRFEHVTTLLTWTNITYANESDFPFYGNFEEILDIIITCHQRTGYYKFQKGTVVSTLRKNHKFLNETCLSVLRRLCKEYGLEYEFEPAAGATYNINIKSQVANDRELTLQYGKGNGLYELTRDRMMTEELCTVLYAYGAAKNLRPDYRNGMRRLYLDANPLKQNEMLDTGWGHHEHHIAFDDIFPQRTSTVTEYLQVLPDDLTPAQEKTFPEGIFRIADSTIEFDVNGYLLGGLTAKIRMKTGNLAGMEFEIQRFDFDFKHIYIIPYKDERGLQFPNASLQIGVGDEYTLVDISQPSTYVSTAEANLLAQAQAYLVDHCNPKFEYRCKVDPALGYKFEVGDRVTIVDTDYAINGLHRISELNYASLTGLFELVLSEKAIPTRFVRTEMRLEVLERATKDTKKDTVESMRKEKETAEELRTRMTDPSDDLFAADRIVRNESIDPRMLAYDAGVPQWYLKDALIEMNVDGYEDKVKIESGEISITNWEDNTLNRYEIYKKKLLGQEYIPTRTWIINETSFTLTTKNAHYMYAKLDLTPESTLCTMEVAEGHREVKVWIEDGYLCYKIANLTTGEETP